MTKWLAVAASVLAVAAGAGAFLSAQENQAEEAGRKAIAAALKDPSATAFRNVQITRSGKTKGVYCVGGDVRFQDKASAFQGFVPFIVVVGPPAEGQSGFAPVTQVIATNRPGVTQYGAIHDRYECALPNVPRLNQ